MEGQGSLALARAYDQDSAEAPGEGSCKVDEAADNPSAHLNQNRYYGDVEAQPVLSYDEWVAAAAKLNRPRTADDVSITTDGRRLDSKEKVLAFLAELEVERCANRAIVGNSD